MTKAQALKTRRHVRPWAGIHLSKFDRSSFVDAIIETISAARASSGVAPDPLLISFLNPFYARATHHNSDLAALVDGFDIVQPDGWGVVYGARLAGINVPERVAIEDVERPLFEAIAARGGSVYLFGSEPGVAQRAASTLTASFPGLRIAGSQHGWLDVEAGHPGTIGPKDGARVADNVRESGADLVMVGLPTPLQQRWTAKYGPRLEVPVVMTVGAYFDKLAEGLDWYPRWMERARLGWVYRVHREPKRLLRRYTVGLVAFAGLVAAEAWRTRKDPLP